MTTGSHDDKLARLEALLDAFGPDAERWPQPRRAEAEALLATSPAARTALREARALEQALAAAPLVSRERASALADRIVAAAVTDAAKGSPGARPASSGVVVPMPRRARTGTGSGTAAPVVARPQRWHLGGIAAALAASLVVGLFLGTADPSAGPFRSLASIARSDDTDQLASVLPGDELSTVLDEDQL